MFMRLRLRHGKWLEKKIKNVPGINSYTANTETEKKIFFGT